MNDVTSDEIQTARVAVQGSLQLDTEDMDRFIEILRSHIMRVREKDGCLTYSFSTDIVEPNTVRMGELWRDLSSLERHLASAEFTNTLQELATIRILHRHVVRHIISDSVQI